MLNNTLPPAHAKELLSHNHKQLLMAMLLGLAIFIAALMGILTRPIGFLASFWPANALLLGLLIRYPKLNHLFSWTLAALGYIAADYMTGSALMLTLALTAANLSFALIGLYLFKFLSVNDRQLEQPISVLYLAITCMLAAIGAASVAVIFALPFAPSLFGHNVFNGFCQWLTADFVNAILILPVILTLPSLRQIYKQRKINQLINFAEHSNKKAAYFAPFLSLLLLSIAAVAIGGPGALVFHVPALMWCALNYRIFTTALLTLIVSVWLIIATNLNMIQLFPQLHEIGYLVDWSISIRLGISLMSLVSLTIVILNTSNNQLMQQLIQAAKFDFLTSALSRSAFYQAAEQLIKSSQAQQTSLSVLMLDIDYFKQVNDRYGHAAGDRVLQQFSKTVQESLRKDDLFARMGGEEFAIVMQGVAFDNAFAVAERIRLQFQNQLIMLDQNTQLNVTVSIGMAHFPTLNHHLIDVLLAQADKALYRAKRAGRNQISYSP